MDLNQVESSDFEATLSSTLNMLFSNEEVIELIDGLIMELEEGSHLYSVSYETDDIGFCVITPLSEMGEPDEIDLISIEDIFIKPKYQNKEIAESLSKQFKTITEKYNVPQVEVIIDQSNSWLSEAMVDGGFISSEIKLEKLLPRTNNLDDVLELIQDCTPIDRIVQVLLERENEFMAEFVDSSDEIMDYLDDGWIPVMVVVTYEPEGSDIDKQIQESDQLINWDDYSIVYYG